MKHTMSVILGLLVLCALAPAGHAGQLMFPNMYFKYTLVQGVGASADEAVKDAESAIPADYQRGLKTGFGQTIGCTVNDAELIRSDGDNCDVRIPGNLVMITFPIVRR
jgi:hypothetical protein